MGAMKDEFLFFRGKEQGRGYHFLSLSYLKRLQNAGSSGDGTVSDREGFKSFTVSISRKSSFVVESITVGLRFA